LNYPLLKPDDIDRDGPPPAQEVLDWVRNYLGTADAEPILGRKYVCPFIPGSLERGSLYIVVADDVTDVTGVERVINEYRVVFHEIEPIEGEETRYKTILVLFPGIAEEDANEAIDGLQAQLKRAIVTEDLLMIGELHPRNQTRAVGVDAEVYPNRSPVPLLALRVIVSQDWERFLQVPLDKESPSEVVIQQLEYQRAHKLALLRWAPNRDAKSAAWELEVNRLDAVLAALSEGAKKPAAP
jgi:hypothetical protein